MERFLPSVVESAPEDVEVIIADNGSTDDSIPFLGRNYPHLRIVALPENMG